MGIFSWLFGNRPKFENRVFGKEHFKFEDLKAKIREDEEAGRTSLILYHFNTMGERLQELFPDATILEQLSRHEITGLTGVTILPISGVPQCSRDSRNSANHHEISLQIHLAERFPVPGPDEALLDFVAYATPGQSCLCYVSLEDPILAPYIGGVKQLLDRLNPEGDECLSSDMLGRSLDNALKKTAKVCRKPWVSADSAKEWMEKNDRSNRNE